MKFKELLTELAGEDLDRQPGTVNKENGERWEDISLPLAIRLVAACVIFALALLIRSLPGAVRYILLIISGLAAGIDVLAAAVLSVMDRRFTDRSVFISLAAVIAFAFGAGTDGAAMLLLFRLGLVFIDYAVSRSGETVMDAVSCRAETARLIKEDGEELVPADSVDVEDVIAIEPGETVPCDCIVKKGESAVDLSPLGGDRTPQSVKRDDELYAGSVNVGKRLECEVAETAEDSAAAFLERNVTEIAARGRTTPETLQKVLKIFPIVSFVLAIAAACLLPLAMDITFKEALPRALVFLVLANTCSMSAAVPLIRLSAVGGASKCGIAYSDCEAMDKAARPDGVVFEAEGTLTEGTPRVTSVKADKLEPELLLKIASHALAYSNTPVARSVIAAYGGPIIIELVADFVEVPDNGVEVKVENVPICVGTRDLMTINGASVPDGDITEDESVYVCIGGVYAGRIIMSEPLRDDAAAGVEELREKNVGTVMMFSTQGRDAAARMASALGIDEYYPEQKREQVIKSVESMAGSPVLVTGGDVPLSSLGNALTVFMSSQEAPTKQKHSAGITLYGGKLARLPLAIGIARYAEMLIYATAAAALLVKLILMVLAVFGIVTLWFAAFIDAAAAVAAALASVLAFSGEK